MHAEHTCCKRVTSLGHAHTRLPTVCTRQSCRSRMRTHRTPPSPVARIHVRVAHQRLEYSTARYSRLPEPASHDGGVCIRTHRHIVRQQQLQRRPRVSDSAEPFGTPRLVPVRRDVTELVRQQRPHKRGVLAHDNVVPGALARTDLGASDVVSCGAGAAAPGAPATSSSVMTTKPAIRPIVDAVADSLLMMSMARTATELQAGFRRAVPSR